MKTKLDFLRTKIFERDKKSISNKSVDNVKAKKFVNDLFLGGLLLTNNTMIGVKVFLPEH